MIGKIVKTKMTEYARNPFLNNLQLNTFGIIMSSHATDTA